MADLVIAEYEEIANVADAIRSKTGITDTMTLSEMASNVMSISGTDMTIDSELSETSTNPVQNKVVTKEIRQLSEEIGDLENIVFVSNPDYGYEFCKWVRDEFEWKAGTGTGFNNSTLTANVANREISLIVNEPLTQNATVQFSGVGSNVPLWDIEDRIAISYHTQSTVASQLQIAWYDESDNGTTIGWNISIGENDYVIPIPLNAKKIKVSALRYLSTETGSILISDLSIVPFSVRKSHVILSFDASGNDMLNDTRYAIVKGEYGWNFNFSLYAGAITEGNKEAIKNGCDIGLYSMDGFPGVNDSVNSLAEEDIKAWENYVNNAVQTFRDNGYYYPISWNCRQGVSGANLEKVCLDNSIPIVRGYYKGADRGELIKDNSWFSKPFVTATASTVSTVKGKIDEAITNGYDICIVSHALYDDVETADANYSLTPDTLREILNRIKTYVDCDKAIVCNFREYYKDINPEACYELDYKRMMGISL